MGALSRTHALSRFRPASKCTGVTSFGYGRTAAYRRLQSTLNRNPNLPSSLRHAHSIEQLPPHRLPSLQPLSPSALLLRLTVTNQARYFSTRWRSYQQAKQTEAKSDDVSSQSTSEAENQSSKTRSGDPEPESSQDKSETDGDQGEEMDGKKQQDKKDQKEPPPPPPHGNKTPWQVFTETLNSEFKKSKEWNESTKAIASGYDTFTQNESLRKARDAYSQATEAATTKTSAAIKTTGKVIGESAGWAWDTTPVKTIRKGASVAGEGLEKATRPLRETEAFKNVKDVIDDGSSSRYGGWVEKEERRRKRELKEMHELAKTGRTGHSEKMEEDPNAGTNVTVHKDAAWKEQWRDFRDSSRVMQGFFNLKSTYNESENPLISTARSISDRFAGFFAENEMAQTIKKFREMDPLFQLEPFLQEMRDYILPEMLEAYIKGDVETLQLWLSAAQYQVYAALMQQYTAAGLRSDGSILDIRNLDILSARILEPSDVPVFILSFRTQETHVYRNAKTGQLAAGMEDKVQQVSYAVGVTRIPEDVSNKETRGWRFIEISKMARDYI